MSVIGSQENEKKPSTGEIFLEALLSYCSNLLKPPDQICNHKVEKNSQGQLVISPKLSDSLVTWLNVQLYRKSEQLNGHLTQKNGSTIFDPYEYSDIPTREQRVHSKSNRRRKH